jgi:hypothetical protein
MTDKKPATPTNITTAASARWLAAALAGARAEVSAGPTPEAVERMRARVLGETRGRERTPTLAA